MQYENSTGVSKGLGEYQSSVLYCKITQSTCLTGEMNIMPDGPKTTACSRLLSELVLLMNEEMKVKHLCHLITETHRVDMLLLRLSQSEILDFD